MEQGKKIDKKNTFLKGALILSIAGLVVRFMGAFFRIPLGNLLSIRAMSNYSAAYPIYAFFIAVATTGFPTAIARLIAESKATGRTKAIDVILRAGVIVMVSIGAVGCLISFFFADAIASAVGNEGAALSLKVLAPGILFCSILSVYRGFFQGFQRMNPFAVSMLVEQFFRVAVGLGLAWALMKKGDEMAAAGATLGATVGGLFGLLYIFRVFQSLHASGRLYNPLGEKISMKCKSTPYDTLAIAFVKNVPVKLDVIVKKIVAIAVPITISASVLPLISVLDVVMVVNRLTDIGFSADRARELFTMMSAYAMTLINFPMAIISGLQISVVPAVTAVYSVQNEKEVRRLIRSAMKINSLIALPSSFGLMALSAPIVGLLYPAQADAVATTGSILAVLAFSVFFLGGYLISTGVYQSIEKPMIPVQNLAIGIVVKVVLTYLLVGMKDVHIIGAAIATLLCYFVAWLLNILRLRWYVPTDYDIANTYTRPVIASAAMALVAYFGYHTVNGLIGKNSIATLVAIFLAMLSYLFLILWMRVLRKDDYEMLPAGSKIRAIERRVFRRKS